MKEIKWSLIKSARLKRLRGVSFEEILTGRLIRIKDHSQRQNQQLMLIEYKNYIWVVPFVGGEEAIFLKTLYPCRKYTKIYRKEANDEKD